MSTTAGVKRGNAGRETAGCRIESNGNVVKIRLEGESPPPGEYRSAVRIGPDETEKEAAEEGSGYGSGGDSGTCSDLDGSGSGTTPPPANPRHWPLPLPPLVHQRTYTERSGTGPPDLDPPHSFYSFHLDEHRFSDKPASEDTFAGNRYLDGDGSTAPIKSLNGTVRGVKNRVKRGIATFLRINDTKWWQEKEKGKVVVYTTTMGIVRPTMQDCLKVRHILRTHLVKYTEKDLFMSRELQAELAQRLAAPLAQIPLPQVFVEGHHIGDADTIEKLNESGELRTLLKPYKSIEACSTCEVCGGYGLLPCGLCNGSKKSVHRNHFTAHFFALKCMNCDEVGLVKCYNC